MDDNDSHGEFQEIPIDDIKPGPIRHSKLPPDLTDQARSLYDRAGHFMYPSFEQWELGFCRDTHPERELAVWEIIATTFETYLAEHPASDQERLLGRVVGISMGGTFKDEDAETNTLRELFTQVWKEQQ